MYNDNPEMSLSKNHIQQKCWSWNLTYSTNEIYTTEVCEQGKSLAIPQLASAQLAGTKRKQLTKGTYPQRFSETVKQTVLGAFSVFM